MNKREKAQECDRKDPLLTFKQHFSIQKMKSTSMEFPETSAESKRKHRHARTVGKNLIKAGTIIC